MFPLEGTHGEGTRSDSVRVKVQQCIVSGYELAVGFDGGNWVNSSALMAMNCLQHTYSVLCTARSRLIANTQWLFCAPGKKEWKRRSRSRKEERRRTSCQVLALKWKRGHFGELGASRGGGGK